MTDERGGRYFREARFFLAGDRVAAQSHILEARSLMGYMRDMQALGGPPIQVKYATLQDGTRIKATMMNGQYRAEIVSPFRGGAKCRRVRVPTIFGYRVFNPGMGTEYKRAFKWQASTGIVYLGIPAGYEITMQADSQPSISLDGGTVAGEVVVTGGGVYAEHVVWYADGTYAVVPAADVVTHLMDVTYGDATPIPVPTIWTESTGDQLNWHRYVGVPEDDCTAAGTRTIFGRVEWPGYYSGALVERAILTPEADVLTVLESLTDNPASMVTDVDMSGNMLVGWSGQDAYGANIPVKWVRPDKDSPFVKAVLGIGLVNDIYVSDDGKTLAGYVARHRLNPFGAPLDDYVPAVWTAEDGLVQLITFIDPPPPDAYQIVEMHGLSSDGLIVVGGNPGGSALAWEKVEGVWQRIPALNLPFIGACVAVN